MRSSRRRIRCRPLVRGGTLMSFVGATAATCLCVTALGQETTAPAGGPAAPPLSAQAAEWPVVFRETLLDPPVFNRLHQCLGQYGGDTFIEGERGLRMRGIHTKTVLWVNDPLPDRFYASVRFAMTKEGLLALWPSGPGHGNASEMSYCIWLELRQGKLLRDGVEVQRFDVPTDIDLMQPHTAEVLRDGPRLAFAVDGRALLDYVDEHPLTGPLHSRFGFGVVQGGWETGVYYRDLEIRAPALSQEERKLLTDVALAPPVTTPPAANGELIFAALGGSLPGRQWLAQEMSPQRVCPTGQDLVVLGASAMCYAHPIAGKFAFEVRMHYVPALLPGVEGEGRADTMQAYLRNGAGEHNFAMLVLFGEQIPGVKQLYEDRFPMGWLIELPAGHGINRALWIKGDNMTSVAETPYYSPIGGRDYVARVERDADRIRVFLDGRLLLEAKQATDPDQADSPVLVGIRQNHGGVVVRHVGICRIQ